MENNNKQTKIYDLYPNPAKDSVNIEFALETESDVNIYLIDFLGKKVESSSIKQHLTRGRYIYELSVSHLSQGNYIVMLQASNSIENRKLIIIK